VQLVSRLEGLGASKLDDDPPATEWIKDWRRLTDARTEFATILSDGKPHAFSIPETDDGYPITIRMTDVAPLECERAVELASQPYPNGVTAVVATRRRTMGQTSVAWECGYVRQLPNGGSTASSTDRQRLLTQGCQRSFRSSIFLLPSRHSPAVVSH
jgi:hypothetical protein